MQRMKRAALLLLIVALSTLMLAAMVWQAQRGLQKQALAEQRDSAEALAPAPFHSQAAYGQHVEISGRFYASKQVLLDNQLVEHRNGVHLWTPLRLADGSLVLVNRGWIPASPDRQQTPDWETPSQAVTLTGYWVRLPRAGVKVANTNCEAPKWPARMVYPSHDELACLYDAPLADGIVQLSPDAAHGFVRDWAVAGLPPSRHFGYALQWFALTVCLWILCLFAWKHRDRSPIQR